MHQAHELDLCRFDISVNDCVWCLRAETEEDKQNWVDVLEGFKVESGYGSENNLTNSNKPDEHYIQSSECTEVLLDDEEIGQLRKGNDASEFYNATSYTNLLINCLFQYSI
ncbi:uncharacterized protein LOC113468484 [Diaphorina citri]|uniref:Uncharacterized protein LOC113468484 n=1 Tax=Diaphorina citri TaxID=121845 RepID=A0A3Q0IYB7_DIACI|nr:uncharacterized protein LOC113468484 [Diaphorina citri]